MVKRHLRGSESRDTFKWRHKQINRRFYAIDLDFILVEKHPPGIVAFIDFKMPNDNVTFAETIAYNAILRLNIAPIYIVESNDPENGPFTVRKYLGGDWKPEPPIIEYGTEWTFSNWNELEDFEKAEREAYRRRKATKHQ